MPTFVDACRENGLIFVGPSAEAQRAMGEKTAARRTAQAAEVPIVPGAMSDVEDDSKASEMAEQLGYPVLLKAAAGGGGKGIRFVRDPKDLLSSLRTAAARLTVPLAMDASISKRPSRRHVTSKYNSLPILTATLFIWVSANVVFNAAIRS